MTTAANSGGAKSSEERLAAALTLSAAVTVIFNVLLAFVKDSVPAVNSFMAALTGHHWRTHGLFDVIVFAALGWFFFTRGIPERGLNNNSTITLAACVIVAGLALIGWFFFN
jgi:hypothetical protein